MYSITYYFKDCIIQHNNYPLSDIDYMYDTNSDITGFSYELNKDIYKKP